MDEKERIELDKTMQDIVSDMLACNENMTRTEAQRKLLCLQDVSVAHTMIDAILEESDDLNIQLHMVDAIMKVCWSIMRVNGFTSGDMSQVLTNFLKGTAFEEHEKDFLEFRRESNKRIKEKNAKH